MGALLRGIKREQLRRGQILALPGTIKAAKKFKAQLYVSCLTWMNRLHAQICVLDSYQG